MRSTRKYLQVLAVAFLCLVSCRDNLTGPQAIFETNLFPFAPGRRFVYTNYYLDWKGQEVLSRFTTTTLVDTVTVGGKTAFTIVDSPAGGLTVSLPRYFLIENDDLMFYSWDSVWMPYFKRSAGTLSEYVVQEDTYGTWAKAVILPAVIIVPVKSHPLVSYGLRITYSVIGGVPESYTVYFSDGYGIVKFAPDLPKGPGQGTHTIDLVSKNF